MGIFDKLFGKRDPTRVWRAVHHPAVDFDFDSHALCGVRLGEPFERLALLGPAESYHQTEPYETLRYFSLGIEIDAKNGLVNRYALIWQDHLSEGYQPFAGTCRHKGRTLTLNANTTEREIKGFLGEPFWLRRGEQEKGDLEEGELWETTFFYEIGDVERIVALSHDGRLLEIEIITPPSLEDISVRKLFGVTKAWPPQK